MCYSWTKPLFPLLESEQHSLIFLASGSERKGQRLKYWGAHAYTRPANHEVSNKLRKRISRARQEVLRLNDEVQKHLIWAEIRQNMMDLKPKSKECLSGCYGKWWWPKGPSWDSCWPRLTKQGPRQRQLRVHTYSSNDTLGCFHSKDKSSLY